MKIYHNLSQCEGKRVVYLRSTDVEQKHYHRLLWSVPDEWFYWLSKGESILIIDRSSNKKGKIERIFIPVLCDILRYFLMNLPPIYNQYRHHFELAKITIKNDRQLLTRIKFWKNKIQIINIKGTTIIVKNEKSIY